jgi:flagellar basal-body rod modification protein FlgD
MIAPTSSYSSSSSSSENSSNASASTAQSVDKNMVMRLMIAQLQNQDPLNPTDGTQFVGQLAQFQQLEQSVNSGQDLTAMRQDLDQLLAAIKGRSPVTQS